MRTFIKGKKKRESKFVHDRDASWDLGPKVVDQIVEIGESVKLEQRMGLIKHRQKPTGRAHQGRHSLEETKSETELGSVGKEEYESKNKN